MYPKTFSSQPLLQDSSSISNKLPLGISPALLINILISLQFSKSIFCESASVKSNGRVITSTEYFFCNSIFNVSSCLIFLAVKYKFTPSAANVLAIAAPIPFDAPVIRAILFFRFKSIF